MTKRTARKPAISSVLPSTPSGRRTIGTAITRGRKLVLLLGVPWAVSKAIETNTVRERRTGLAERLERMGAIQDECES